MNDYKTKKEFQSQNRLIYLFILGVLIYFVIFVPLYIFKKKEQKLIVACVISVLTGYSIIKEGFVKAYKETKKIKN